MCWSGTPCSPGPGTAGSPRSPPGERSRRASTIWDTRAGAPPPATQVLTVRGLTKTYGSAVTAVDAVRAVDLDVAAGEVVLVMVPSGSGKTTLLLMLGALLRTTAGSITVTSRNGRNVDIATAPEKQLPILRSDTFGFIFQNYALLDALTATESIAVAANLAGTTGTVALDRAIELLDRIGLAQRAGAVHRRCPVGRSSASPWHARSSTTRRSCSRRAHRQLRRLP